MKKYETPIMEEILLEAEDVILASGILNGIVSSGDQSGSSETQESSWNDAWN